MKKIVAMCLVSILVGCTNTQAVNYLTKAKVVESSFDGKKQAYTQPMYIFASKGKHAAPVSLGAFWVEGVSHNVSVDVVLNGYYLSIKTLELSFDGEIKSYPAISQTDFEAPNSQILSQRSSTKRFVLPISDIEKFKTSQMVKLRVTTDKGAFEGDVVKKGELSPGAISIMNVVNEALKIN